MESTPKDLEPWDIAHTMQIEEQNALAYVHGMYVMEAIASCFAKNHKYPNKPYKFDDGMDTLGDEEANERLAVLEMEKYIKSLEKEGIKRETIMNE